MKKVFSLVVASFLAVAFSTPALAQCSYEDGKWNCVQNDGDRAAKGKSAKADKPSRDEDKQDIPDKDKPDKGDKDNGHGNEEDGRDESNPGKGKGNGPKK